MNSKSSKDNTLPMDVGVDVNEELNVIPASVRSGLIPGEKLRLEIRHVVHMKDFPNKKQSEREHAGTAHKYGMSSYTAKMKYHLLLKDENDNERIVWSHQYRWGIEWSGEDTRKKQIVELASRENSGRTILSLDDDFPPIQQLASIMLYDQPDVEIDDTTDDEFMLYFAPIHLLPGVKMSNADIERPTIVSKEQLKLLKELSQEVADDKHYKPLISQLREFMTIKRMRTKDGGWNFGNEFYQKCQDLQYKVRTCIFRALWKREKADQ